MKNKLFINLIVLIVLIGSCKKGDSTEISNTTTKGIGKMDSPSVKDVLGIAIIEPWGGIVPLGTEQSGIIKSVKANIGDKLNKNDIILIMDNTLENAQIQQSNSKTNTQNEVINTANQNLKQLQLKLQKANVDLQRDLNLNKRDALTKKELESSQYVVQDILKQIEIQQATIHQQQVKLKEFKADVNYFQTIENKKLIKAPSNGTLLSLDVKSGQFLNFGQLIGDFAPDGPVMALTEIDELYADKIKIGQKAVIKRQGKNEVITTGTVKLTSPYLQKKSLFSDNPSALEDRRVREVRVQIDEPEKVLIGSRVECIIYID